MSDIRIIHSSCEYAASYCKAVDKVARELQYLAVTVGFPEESTVQFVYEIEQNNHAQYFAVAGECVVGWCDILPKSVIGFDHVGVLGMGMLNEYRGRGIGTHLFRETKNHAKEINKLEKVELEVFETNITAVRFYEKTGFQREGIRRNSRKIRGVYDNIILMGLFI